MYGLVNQAIKEVVIGTLDENIWNSIYDQWNIDKIDFESFKQYDHDLTANLVQTISLKTGIETTDLLCSFGHYWV